MNVREIEQQLGIPRANAAAALMALLVWAEVWSRRGTMMISASPPDC